MRHIVSYRMGMRRDRSTAVLLLLVLSLAAAGLFVLTGPLPAAQRKRRAIPPSRQAGPSVPFRAGERLFYQIGYMSMSEAATAELQVMPRLGFYGDPAWHFQATAHSQYPLRYMLPLDDQFDSYADTRALVTRQYELYLHESGKDSAEKLALNVSTPGAKMISAPIGTRDPLATLYAIRANDWRRDPEMRSTVFDGRHFYEMTARIEAKHGSVTVPAGTFDASRISVSVASAESSSSMLLTIWLANDSVRTPVEIDANIPIGTVKGLLVRIE